MKETSVRTGFLLRLLGFGILDLVFLPEAAMLDLREKDGAVLLRVHLQPGASKDAIAGEHAGALKVKVHALPEKGRANRAAVEFLAGYFGLKRAAVTLIRGDCARDKVFALKGMDIPRLLAVLKE